MSKWKITMHFANMDLTYYVNYFQEREGRILFKDERTGLSKNFPYDKCSIEEVKD